MKKISIILAALFAFQSAVALAEHQTRGGEAKDHQIVVGNEKAAESGATSDSKVVKEDAMKKKDHEAKEADDADSHDKADKAKKPEKKEKKENKGKRKGNKHNAE